MKFKTYEEKSKEWGRLCNIARSRNKKSSIAMRKYRENNGKSKLKSLIFGIQYVYQYAMTRVAEERMRQLND